MSILILLVNVLFVGHSLIGPALPAMVEGGLALQGQPMTVPAQVINGAPLRYSWDNRAQGARDDARVILPRGQTAVSIRIKAVPVAAQITRNDSAGHVAKFAGLAWQARPETQVHIHETWPGIPSAPGVADPGSTTSWRNSLTADLPLWRGMAASANAARPKGAPLVRLADVVAVGKVPGPDSLAALFDDDVRPSHQTIYFLALVHLCVITGQTPAGLPPQLTRQ
jgi:hypothetical protein